jgi:hypothetical protein
MRKKAETTTLPLEVQESKKTLTMEKLQFRLYFKLLWKKTRRERQANLDIVSCLHERMKHEKFHQNLRLWVSWPGWTDVEWPKNDYYFIIKIWDDWLRRHLKEPVILADENSPKFGKRESFFTKICLEIFYNYT